jgi:hypothetical protein
MTVRISAASKAELVRELGLAGLLGRLFEARVVAGGPEPDAAEWIVFRDGQGRGFAVAGKGPPFSGGRLAAASGRVRLAACIESIFGGMPDGLVLDDCTRPPDDWPRRVFTVGNVAVACASRGIAFEPAEPPDDILNRCGGRYRFICVAEPSGGTEGERIVLKAVGFRCPELNLTGAFLTMEGTVMTFALEQSNIATDEAEFGLTMELGGLTLSLRELAALAAGTRLKLECSSTIPCILKLGARGLVRGELVRLDEGFSLLVSEILG